MKTFAFFKSKLSLISKIRLHKDGLSLPDYFSLRLSNIPHNVNTLFQMLAACEGKLFLGIMFRLLQDVLADTCYQFEKDTSDIFLTQENNNSNLWVQHTKNPNLAAALNNSCGFFLSDKKNVSYSLKNCLCNQIGKDSFGDVVFTATNIYIYSYNTSDQLIDCISAAINEIFCPPPTPEQLRTFGIIMGSLLFSIICCVSCYHGRNQILQLGSQIMRFFRRAQPQPLHNVALAEETHYSYGVSLDDSHSPEPIAETPSPHSPTIY